MKLLYPSNIMMFILPLFIFLLSTTSSSDAFQPQQRYTYLKKLGNPAAVFSRVVTLENTAGKKESWSPPSGKWNKNKRSNSSGVPGYTDGLGSKSGSGGSGYRYKGGVTGKGIPTFTDGLLGAESLEFSYSSSEPTSTTPEVTSDVVGSSTPPPPSTGGYLDTISPASSASATKGSYRYNPKKNEPTEALPFFFDSFNQAKSLPASASDEEPGAAATSSSFIESVTNTVAYESNGRAPLQPTRVVNGIATSIFLEFPPTARVRVDSAKAPPKAAAPEDVGSKVKYIPISPFCTIIEPK